MKEVLLRTKAIFIISIILIAIFYSPLNTSAQPTEETCCEETISGDFCIEATSNYCKPGKFRNAPCTETSACSSIIDGGSLGCCYFPNSLDACSNRVPQGECTRKNGVFLDNPQCSSFSECSLGCCVLGSQADLKTQTQCNLLSQSLGLQMDFREGITDQFACAALSDSQTQGCCVNNGVYTYSTRSECSSIFHEGQVCSNLQNSPCTSGTGKKACFNDEVWNLDSCGNKDKNSNGDNAPEETCDYNKGKLCEELINTNDARCVDINCQATYSDEINIHDPELGNFRDNGESWCVYEGPTGEYFDRPGSRHYRFTCLNGEEIIEPCRNFREEVCIQSNPESSTENPLGGASIGDLFAFGQNLPLESLNQLSNYFNILSPILSQPLELEPGFNSAECIRNDIYEKDLTQEQSSVPLGFAFWEFKGVSSLNALVPQGAEGILGQVSGQIATSLQEQRAQTPVEGLSRQESSRDGSEICAQGSLPPIKVKWEVGVLCANKAVKNEFAEKQDFIDQAAETCRSYGDCGVDFNVLGEQSPKGPPAIPFVSGVVNLLTRGYPPSFPVNWRGSAPGDKPTQVSILKINKWKNAKGVYQGMKQLSLYISDTKKQIITQLGGIGGSGSGGPLKKAGYTLAGVSAIAVTPVALAATGVISTATAQAITFLPPVDPITIIIDIAIIVTLIILGDCDYPEKTVTVSCNPWEAPSGGEDCILCNSLEGLNLKDANGNTANNCNEYKCKSLGKACEFIETINGGTCIEGSSNDAQAPVISPDDTVLALQSLTYEETTSGYTIKRELPAFFPLTLAIKTDEPATCFYEDHTTDNIEEMANSFGSTLPSTKQSLEITHPPSNPDSPTETTYYIRCKDTYDNPSNQYTIIFTTKKAQDLAAPLVNELLRENSFLKFEQTETSITLLVSDSSKVECKYSTTPGKRFDAMESDLLCIDIRPDNINYHCTALLQDLNQGENKFYFKCQDNAGNLPSQEKELILIGSSELTVTPTSPSPSGIIFNKDITLAVVTSGGAEDGFSECIYSLNGRFIDKMKNTGEKIHTQSQVGLTNGNYRYDITCGDIAQNKAQTTIEFTIDIGEDVVIIPKLIHTYKENQLFIILNKQTTCEYNPEPFSYGNGTPMTEPDSTVHSAPLGLSKYHIRCKDAFDNDLQPIEIIP